MSISMRPCQKIYLAYPGTGHGAHTLHLKFVLFACQLLVFGVPLLTINVCLGLGLFLE